MTVGPGTGGPRDPIAPDVEALLLESLSVAPEARESFLSQATDDPAIRALVQDLLAAHARGEQRFNRLAERLGLADSAPIPAMSRAGPYRLLRELGRGGMSVVYLGRRDDGEFEQQVAVKVLAPGPGNDAMVRRFQTERQLLARLSHPNIARLLDGGKSAEGWPYLVMEHVDGVSITDYCDSLRLGIDERLALFQQVLSAVQYAHRNLVVHRDIKPSNILVTLSGEVKLLDFGIAKMLDEDGSSEQATELTRLSGRPMTPLWASPEQMLGQPVTTASDIYTLGALLYLLLCGRPPYRGTLQDSESLRRAILDVAPLPPSKRLLDTEPDSASQQAAALAPRRSTTMARLRRQLRGDLDIICLNALRKEPDRRYATAEQMAEDVARYLGRLPIRARPETLPYRLGKLARRHPVGLSAALAVPLGIAAGLFVHTERLSAERDRAEMEAVRAEAAAVQAQREADRARVVSDYLVNLFRSADPHFASDHATLTAADLVERGVRGVDELADTPELQASMLVTLGYIYRNLGETGRAVELMRTAVDVLSTVPGEHDDGRIDAHNALGLALAEHGAQHEAVEHYRIALTVVSEEEPLRRATVLNNLAATLNALGDYEGAEAVHREGLAIRLRHDAGPYEEALSRNNLGAVLWRQGRTEEALAEFQQALTLRLNDPDMGPEHPWTTTSMGNVAASLMALGRLDEAYDMYGEALRLRRGALGADHPRNAALLHMMGQLRFRLEDIAGAERYWSEALAIRRAGLPDTHASTGASLNAMARIALHRGEFERTEALLTEALNIKLAAYGDDHPGVADVSANLARLRTGQRRFDEARELLHAALEVRVERLGERHATIIETLRQLVDLELAADDPAAALVWAEQALSLARADPRDDDAGVLELQRQVAELSARVL